MISLKSLVFYINVQQGDYRRYFGSILYISSIFSNVSKYEINDSNTEVQQDLMLPVICPSNENPTDSNVEYSTRVFFFYGNSSGYSDFKLRKYMKINNVKVVANHQPIKSTYSYDSMYLKINFDNTINWLTYSLKKFIIFFHGKHCWVLNVEKILKTKHKKKFIFKLKYNWPASLRQVQFFLPIWVGQRYI